MIQTNTRSGFSLVEMLIVLGILAVVGAIALPSLFSYLEGARVDATKHSLRTLKTTLQTVQMRTGRYPEQLKDLLSKEAPSEDMREWHGPYLEKKTDLEDRWNNKFHYRLTPGEAHEFELYSYGPKGKAANKSEYISVWDV